MNGGGDGGPAWVVEADVVWGYGFEIDLAAAIEMHMGGRSTRRLPTLQEKLVGAAIASRVTVEELGALTGNAATAQFVEAIRTGRFDALPGTIQRDAVERQAAARPCTTSGGIVAVVEATMGEGWSDVVRRMMVGDARPQECSLLVTWFEEGVGSWAKEVLEDHMEEAGKSAMGRMWVDGRVRLAARVLPTRGAAGMRLFVFVEPMLEWASVDSLEGCPRHAWFEEHDVDPEIVWHLTQAVLEAGIPVVDRQGMTPQWQSVRVRGYRGSLVWVGPGYPPFGSDDDEPELFGLYCGRFRG